MTNEVMTEAESPRIAITIEGEPVMTFEEWDVLVRVEQLKTIAEFTERPGYQNGMAKLEEMEARQ